jgi:hypothetical protein
MIDKHVGRCTALRSPARDAWRGSLGYRSSDRGRRCRTLQAQSVTSIHATKLPRSPLGRYDRYWNIRVSTYGGAPRGAYKSYLVSWYWSRGAEWIARSQFSPRVELHAGRRLGSKVVHGDPAAEKPYVVWSAGLAEGAQYDVKNFVVEASYYDIGYR